MRKVIFLFALISSAVSASNIPECEYMRFEGSITFVLSAKFNFFKLPKSEAATYYLSSNTKISLTGKKSKYDIFTTTNKDYTDLQSILRVKYKKEKEVKRNDLTLSQQTNSFLLRNKNATNNEPFYEYGEILKKGQTLDLTSMIYYLRSLDLKELENSNPFYLYLLGPKGSLDNQKQPREYSRMSFKVTKQSNLYKVSLTIVPKSNDISNQNDQLYEYIHIYLNDNSIKKPQRIVIKTSGKPSLELKLKSYKVLKEYSINNRKIQCII